MVIAEFFITKILDEYIPGLFVRSKDDKGYKRIATTADILETFSLSILQMTDKYYMYINISLPGYSVICRNSFMAAITIVIDGLSLFVGLCIITL